MENTNTNNVSGSDYKQFIDSKIIEVIDDTIQKLRDILDQVEGLVHEVWDIVQIIAAMIAEARRMFQSRPQAEGSAA